MLYDVDKIFTKNNISYWIEGGTLLGAVRNKGLIPWDEDCDICIIRNNITAKLHELPKLTNDLFKHGYYIQQTEVGYKILIINNTFVNLRNWSVPFMDILLMRR